MSLKDRYVKGGRRKGQRREVEREEEEEVRDEEREERLGVGGRRKVKGGDGGRMV